jgi:hypothetical protein
LGRNPGAQPTRIVHAQLAMARPQNRAGLAWRGPHGTGQPVSEAPAGAQRRPRRQRAHTRPERTLARLQRAVHTWSAGRGTAAREQRLIGGREGLAGSDHWKSATPHGKVLRISSSQTAMATRGRCSPVVTLCPHWNRGARWPEVGGVASPRQEGALGPAHEDGRRVRRLGTDSVAK